MDSLLIYAVKRSLGMFLVLFVIIVFLTVLVQFLPGDPAKLILGPRASAEMIEKVNQAMDLDKPVHIQVFNFIYNLLQGDLGSDIFTRRSISAIIGNALPHTVALTISSLFLAVIVGIPLGIFSATNSDSWVDRITSVISISLITIPSYVGGLLLLIIFAVEFGVLPARGTGEPGNAMDMLRHLVLPASALAITWIGYFARLVRSSFLEVLNEDYIKAARAFGHSERMINYKYALKNAIIPTVAILGVAVGTLMSGAVFIEIIFSRPGMGSMIYSAIETRNYPLVRAGVLVTASLYVLANFFADIANAYLDPRIQLGKRRS